MPIYSLGDRVPRIDDRAYVHPSAEIIGDVIIERDAFIGPCAVIRGDIGTIHIGPGTAVEDNCVLHVGENETMEIGRNVIIGHGAVLHGSLVEDEAIIGMNAVLSHFSRVGEWAVVAEGAVVKKGFVVPPRALCAGVPAKIIRENYVDEEYMATWSYNKANYRRLAAEYKKIKKINP